MHVIAGKAVCFHEALQPAFKSYRNKSCATPAPLRMDESKWLSVWSAAARQPFDARGCGRAEFDRQRIPDCLDDAGITVNKNTIPFETRSPFQASGVRLGTPAVTTRGMKEAEMAAVADMISEVLLDIKNLDAIAKVRQRVRELTARFPLPY